MKKNKDYFFRDPRNMILRFLISAAVLLSSCSVQIYDLQPVIPTVATATPYRTATQFVRKQTTPRSDVTKTPPIHIAPTSITAMTAVNILDLVMVNGGTGWAVGQVPGGTDKLILRTADGGTNWKNVTPPDAIYANTGKNMDVSTYFLDAHQAWVLFWETDAGKPGNGVTLWRTTTGGDTWDSAEIPTDGYSLQYFRDVQIGFADPDIGWIFVKLGKTDEREFIGIFTTHNGGADWEVKVTSDSANLQSMGEKNGVVFRNALYGWVTGSNTRTSPGAMLWETTDGGNTWALNTLPNPDGEDVPEDLLTNADNRCSLSVPKFVDFQLQYMYMKLNCTIASGNTEKSWIYWSYDAGATWRTFALPKAQGNLTFYGIYQGWYSVAADPGATSAYEILYTEDGGSTWTSISQTAWDSRLKFITAAVGWGIVTYQGQQALVHTEDGGYSWTQIFPMVTP